MGAPSPSPLPAGERDWVRGDSDPQSALRSSSQFRIRDITKAVGDEVEGENRDEDGEAGEDRKPGRIG